MLRSTAGIRSRRQLSAWLADQRVDLLAVVERALDQRLGVWNASSSRSACAATDSARSSWRAPGPSSRLLSAARPPSPGTPTDRSVEDLRQGAAAQVALVEHLDRHLPCRAPLACCHETSPRRPQWKTLNENKGRSRDRERPAPRAHHSRRPACAASLGGAQAGEEIGHLQGRERRLPALVARLASGPLLGLLGGVAGQQAEARPARGGARPRRRCRGSPGRRCSRSAASRRG